MQVIFDHKDQESSNIWTFYFKAPDKVSYTAGQYIELTLKHDNPDDRGIKRWFTLSSSPSDDLLSITTRILTPENGQRSSFKNALASLAPNYSLSMSTPMGDFVLPKLLQTPLVFVAGGIGITPFHSILKWLSETNEERPIKFIYAVRNEEDIIFQDTFTKASQHVSIIVDHPSEAWGGIRGNLSAELIVGLSELTEDSLIYVSGPEPMVENIEKELKQSGISKDQLVLDFFPNYKTI